MGWMVGGVFVEEVAAVPYWLAFVVEDFVGRVGVVDFVDAFGLVASVFDVVDLVVGAAVGVAFAVLVIWVGCFEMKVVFVVDELVVGDEEEQEQLVFLQLVVGEKVRADAAAVGDFVVVEVAPLVDSGCSVVC